jgi:N-methylhydantoinase A/oxoprolinase/acetone carboxylase beta subunit
VLAAAFDHDGLPASTVATALVQRSLDRQHDVVDLGIALDAPLVGLGAAARTYAPPAAELLRARVVLPEHHDVANAIGAVVGRVRITIECTITAPTEGQFLVHLPDGSWPATSLDEAQARALAALTTSLDEAMRSAGATDYETHRKWSQRSADLGGTELFVEGVLRLTASGRPDVDRVG